MTLRDIYPLTSTMIFMGISAILYGLYSSSVFMILQGLYLFWLGLTTMLQAAEAHRLGS